VTVALAHLLEGWLAARPARGELTFGLKRTEILSAQANGATLLILAGAGVANLAAWLGVAQACSLMPGVSRNGATLAAARRRQFTREDANRLSRHAALPVIAGATALKTVRLRRRGLPPAAERPLAIGAGAAFLSTLASRWLIGQVERNRSLAPYAAYRLVLALAIVARLHAHREHPSAAAFMLR